MTNISGKKIWDLTLEEIEYAYRNLHINNYVYAALSLFHKSKIPFNKAIRIRKGRIPKPLHEPAEKITSLSRSLGNDDPRKVRIAYTYHAFRLFQSLRSIKPKDAGRISEFLATIAYIPITAEKNDGLNIWLHPVIRTPSVRINELFQSIRENIDFNSFFLRCLYPDEKIESFVNPAQAVFLFMRAVQSIIVMCENGADPQALENAWDNLEANLRAFEESHGLAGKQHEASVVNPGCIRYRNTLYLYGGDFFRRRGNVGKAFAWYTRDIFFNNITDFFKFYLTDMKTTERLLSAYALSKNGKPDKVLRELIEKCMYTLFRNASKYADDMLNFISAHPEADLSLPRIPDGKRYRLYAGEASREPFLISLLYNRIVNDTRYEDMEYEKYLAF
jgi:hypothetical protein